MAHTVCGYCGKDSHLTVVWGEVADLTLGPDTPARIAQGAFVCDNCKRVSAGYLVSGGVGTVASGGAADTQFQQRPADARWFPKIGSAPTIEDAPPEITAAAAEAWACASVNCNMAAILMARTVIEATAKAKGITSGPLVNKIDEMKTQNRIRPDIAAVAHAIRHFGNDMAHGDIGDQPSAQDADDVLRLMMQILGEVFTGPALLVRVQQRNGTTT